MRAVLDLAIGDQAQLRLTQGFRAAGAAPRTLDGFHAEAGGHVVAHLHDRVEPGPGSCDSGRGGGDRRPGRGGVGDHGPPSAFGQWPW